MQLIANTLRVTMSKTKSILDRIKLDDVAARWTLASTAAGNAFLGSGKSPPFGKTIEELVDLRGLRINQFIKNVTIRGIDLSASSAEGFGQFGFCNVMDSRMVAAQLQTNLGSKFIRCDFSHANLSGVVLRGEFDEADFTDANLKSASANQVVFRRCRFSRAIFRKANLLHCTFEDCRFERCSFGSGSIAGSKFVRSHLALDVLKKTVTENAVFID